MRVRERLLELDQLGVREGRPVAALLPARVVVQAGDGRRLAVVLGKVASVVVLVRVVVVVVAVDVIEGRRDDHRLRGAARIHADGSA